MTARTFQVRVIGIAMAAALSTSADLPGQERALVQDPTLDNLVHAPGTSLAAVGTLGAVSRSGTGARAMILIPGLGFGGSVFDDFVARRASAFRMYAVTLPGFGGTPPLPDRGAAWSAQWTESAERAILELMDRERIGRATLVGHWIHGSQLALRLAIAHPDRFDGVVLLAGVAKSYYSSDTSMLHWSPQRRVAQVQALAGQWFRTVTRRTWDEQNFLPYDYAVHPLRAHLLWSEAASPALPVWIRYLLEFYSLDVTVDVPRLRVPTLLVRPGLDDPAFFVEPGRPYMRDLLHESWRDIERQTPSIETVTIRGARTFVWKDDPAALEAVLVPFLEKIRRP
jgi:pimeloyl-ACP methyl ester carboxylesterase